MYVACSYRLNSVFILYVGFSVGNDRKFRKKIGPLDRDAIRGNSRVNPGNNVIDGGSDDSSR